MDNRTMADRMASLSKPHIRIRGRLVSVHDDGLILGGHGVEYEVPKEYVVAPVNWGAGDLGKVLDVDVRADAKIIQRRLVDDDLLSAMAMDLAGGEALSGDVDCCRCTDCRCVCDCHDCSRCAGDCHDCSRCAGGGGASGRAAGRFRRPVD